MEKMSTARRNQIKPGFAKEYGGNASKFRPYGGQLFYFQQRRNQDPICMGIAEMRTGIFGGDSFGGSKAAALADLAAPR